MRSEGPKIKGREEEGLRTSQERGEGGEWTIGRGHGRR